MDDKGIEMDLIEVKINKIQILEDFRVSVNASLDVCNNNICHFQGSDIYFLPYTIVV